MQRRYRLGVALATVIAVAVRWVTLVSLGGPDGRYYLDATPADGPGPANETVDYGELRPGQQRVFRSAVNSTDHVEIPDGVDEDAFIDDRYVRYRNRTYEVVVASSD